jgi:hypothetical protein
LSPTCDTHTLFKKETFHKKTHKEYWLVFFAVWLIAWGLFTLIPGLNGLGMVLAALAIAA